jgi:hypothetical protein
MNWNQHMVGLAIAFLIATVFVVSGVVWAVLILVGGQPLAHEVLGENLVRTFMVLTFAFLAITQVLVMLFFWGALIIVGGKWLKYHFRRFWETEF